MSDDDTFTITLPVRDGLARHIEDLQRVITRRNAEIEALKQRLDGEGESEQMQRARRDGFKAGWAAHRNRVSDALSNAERALREANHAAWLASLPAETEPTP